jgi:hypothetical protein
VMSSAEKPASASDTQQCGRYHRVEPSPTRQQLTVVDEIELMIEAYGPFP